MRFIPSGIELPDQFGAWVLKRRLWIVVFVGLITAAAAVQVARMPVQTSLLESFVQDPTEFNRYRSRTATFGGDGDDLIYIATQDKNTLFTPAAFTAIRAVAKRLQAIPEVAHVTCLADAYWVKDRGQLTAREVINRSIARRQLAVGKFKLSGKQLGIGKYWPDDPAERAAVDLAKVRQAMLADERTAGLLLSTDGTTQIIVVQLTSADDLPPKTQMRIKDEIVECVRAGGLGKDGIFAAGMPVSQGWMFEEVGRALRVLFPIGMLVICATVYFLFQRLSVVMITAVIGAMAIVWSIALTSLVFGKLSVLVAAAPLVIMVISTSDVIHLATAYQLELKNGLSREDALRKVMREVGGACILTSITTFVGFMSLMLIPAPSTRHLALAAAVGVGCALLLAVTLVPIAFSFLRPLPVDGGGRLIRMSNGFIKSIVNRCHDISMRYSWSVISVCMVLLVGGLACLPLMHIDIDYARRFRPHHPLRKSMDFFQQKLSGSTGVEIFLKSKSGSLLDPATLRAIADLERKLDEIPEVTAVHSVSMLFRLTDQILNFKTADGLPETRVMAESCAKIFRDIDPRRLDSVLTPDGQQARITVQLNVSGFLAIADVAARMDEITRQTLPDDVDAEVSGSYPIIGRIVRVMVRSQLLGLATCFLSISVIMAFGLKSLRDAMFAQLPNILPAVLILAFLAVALPVVDVDMLGLPTVALGLAVDDTIHFLHRYRLELARSENKIAALDKTFAFTGQAILKTTLILCFGLLPFALGSFLTVWMLGTYLVATLFLAVLGDLLLLPALIQVGIINGKKLELDCRV